MKIVRRLGERKILVVLFSFGRFAGRVVVADELFMIAGSFFVSAFLSSLIVLTTQRYARIIRWLKLNIAL
ncbi:MAG: hypothetical protein AAB316_02880 [Bacteroidota bacterium]